MYNVLIIRRENACFSFFLFYVNVFTNIYYFFLSFFPSPVFWVSQVLSLSLPLQKLLEIFIDYIFNGAYGDLMNGTLLTLILLYRKIILSTG